MSILGTNDQNSFSPSFFLAICMLVAAALSVFVWMGQSLRLDEAQSIWQTSRSLWGVIDVIAKDVHMPLYFLGLHFWEVLFGVTELSLRAFSLVFFLLSIPAMYILGSEAYSQRVGFYCALATTISPFLNWYGSEGRMYSLLFFMTVVSHIFFLRTWKYPTKFVWLSYAFVSILGLFTHVFFIFIIAVQAGFFAANRNLFAPYATRSFRRLGLAIGMLGGLWLVLRTIAGSGLANPLLSKPTSVDFFNVFSNFFIGFQTDLVNTFFLSLWPIAVFIGFTFLSKRKNAEVETAYLASSAFIPVILTFIVSVVYHPAFLSRYLIVSLPSLYLLSIYFLSSYKSRGSTVSLLILLSLMTGFLFVQAYDPGSPVKEDYRSVSNYVAERAGPDDLFVVSAPFLTYPIEYYYQGSARLATFPHWDRFAKGLLPDPYTPDLIGKDSDVWSKVYKDVYLLLGYDQGYEEAVRLYMDTHYARLDMKTFSPGLTLYVYKLRYIRNSTSPTQ